MRTFALRVAPLWFLLVGTATCEDSRNDYFGPDVDNPDTFCRENPRDCFGEIGGDCDFTDDCGDGVCCRDKNCGAGTCLYICDNNRDCPSNTLCEHGYCFFRCDRDSDCGGGQRCEHGDTICEYED